MKKSVKRSRKLGIKKTQMKRESKNKKPQAIKPILYTRGLKSNKQKKIKKVSLTLWNRGQSDKFDDDPKDRDDQRLTGSFREMMRVKKIAEKHKNPYKYDSNAGDIRGAKKITKLKKPKIGKKETPESFARRLDRDVQDENIKLKLAKKNNAPLVDPETFKSRKSKKNLKRLAVKKEMKRGIRQEKRRTGFEHLKDKVAFGEVVMAPPVLKTLPKKVGGAGSAKQSPKPQITPNCCDV